MFNIFKQTLKDLP